MMMILFYFILLFFAFILKELLFGEAYSARSIPSKGVEGIDPSIHRVDKSFKLQLLGHVFGGSSNEIRHEIP